ncbi:MAG: competence/damage-inducible protein A [Candidatus Neomarinimicrobiota bacterium]
MRIGLITIGNELLQGYTVDTNAAWIGKNLGALGISVESHLTIPDKKNVIVETLNDAQNKGFDVVISTGGLGPTLDDITPSAFYTFFGAKPVFDNDYWEYLSSRFEKRGIKISEINRNQAMVPDKGEILENPVGSARGLHFESSQTHFFALPGVPAEMKAMMSESVLPFLSNISKKALFLKTLRTTGLPESTLAEKIDDIVKAMAAEVNFAFLPQSTGVDIRISSDEESVLKLCLEKLEKRLKRFVYGYDEDRLEEIVGKLLLERKYTIAIAESCTGGLVSNRLTNVPGSSGYFMGGVVSYSDQSKMKLLNVKSETLDNFGAVSENTAGEMAVGVQSLFKTDVGVSVTGIAGPGGYTDLKPVGLVYIGIRIHRNEFVKQFTFTNSRDYNKRLSSQAALNLLRLELTP